ncbi:MAG: archease [Candidatus Heimdallarchaeota archaeon]|nr:archease [Candidatus Heimdallarchaeota archaeon]
MPVEFLEDEAIADIAFKVRGESLKQIFIEACTAVFGLQTDINLLDSEIEMGFELSAQTYERLLYNVLSEILYFRDAEYFFGKSLVIEFIEGVSLTAKGKFIGCEFNEEKHIRGNEVKAITMHDFYLREVSNGWEAYILVDI